MIYETAVVVRTDVDEKKLDDVKKFVTDSLKDVNGEVLVSDDWGVKTFAQPTSSGATQGHYLYFMYQADGSVNQEIERRYKISEDVLKFIFVKLGKDKEKEAILKAYKNPGEAKKEDKQIDTEKEKKLFQKRKTCWFSAKKTEPDWKDPKSYAWLVNEFGKISPARVTGLRPKFQRMATSAIKRGRCMGLISYMSNQVAR